MALLKLWTFSLSPQKLNLYLLIFLKNVYYLNLDTYGRLDNRGRREIVIVYKYIIKVEIK